MGQRGRKPTNWQDRIDKFIDKSGECWIWLGKKNNSRHGPQFGRGINEERRSQSARCLVFIKEKGYNPGRCYPECGNKLCVKPEHQKIGCSCNTRISKDQQDEIRTRWKLHLQYDTTMKKLGREYGVTKQRIEQIVRDIQNELEYTMGSFECDPEENWVAKGKFI